MDDAMAIRELAIYCALAGLAGAVAAEPDHTAEAWRPTSHTAKIVTGHVTLTATLLRFQNGASLTLVSGGQMLFRSESKQKKVMADLYRVAPPDDPVLEDGNKLCKGKPVTYVIMWKPEKAARELDPRTLAFFSGPKFDPGSADDCGRYTYDAGKPQS
jgi:hypothetical protein